MKKFLIILLSLAFCQNVVNVGGGSYASAPPDSVWDEDFYGTNYRMLRDKYANNIPDSAKQKPLPTNKWWSNYWFSDKWGGYAWAFPGGVRTEGDGSIDVLIPTNYAPDGDLTVKMDFSMLFVQHNNFKPAKSTVQDWTDLGFTFREQDGAAYIDTTLIHGVPFTYFDFQGVKPHLGFGGGLTFFGTDGNEVKFPATLDAFGVDDGKVIFGVHVKPGTTFQQANAEIDSPYLIISTLPSRGLLATYDSVARNKPTDTIFKYDYNVQQGKVSSTFVFDTTNLDTGAKGGNTIFTLLPHQWRTATLGFKLIDGATFKTIRGLSKLAEPAASYTLTYDFGGFPPYLPAPQDLSAAQSTNLGNLIKAIANTSNGKEGNTYAKGFGEKTTVMFEAYATGATADADQIKTNLIAQLQDWFTYDKAETKQYFFSEYPEYGALIGWPCAYGSQGFNDLHFHYGYFVLGAARLMLVDQQFRQQYGPFVKYLAASYANPKHYNPAQPKGPDNPYFPFLRTFDTYEGHSYAGGTGDVLGNNQESTSEALNSWWGIFTLGIALNDNDLIALGAVGYKLEVTAASEYWLDLYNENLPDVYGHEYVGIVRSHQIQYQNYFSGDPAWTLGIQFVPVDEYYTPYGEVPGQMERVWKALLQDSVGERGTADPFENIQKMEPYLGGYHLNILASYDPATAASYLDRLYALGGDWAKHVNIASIYYLAHAFVTYGRPAKGYSTSVASGAVFQNSNKELTYIIYNALDTTANVQIFNNGAVVDTVSVGAHTLFNSRAK